MRNHFTKNDTLNAVNKNKTVEKWTNEVVGFLFDIFVWNVCNAMKTAEPSSEEKQKQIVIEFSCYFKYKYSQLDQYTTIKYTDWITGVWLEIDKTMGLQQLHKKIKQKKSSETQFTKFFQPDQRISSFIFIVFIFILLKVEIFLIVKPLDSSHAWFSSFYSTCSVLMYRMRTVHSMSFQ